MAFVKIGMNSVIMAAISETYVDNDPLIIARIVVDNTGIFLNRDLFTDISSVSND